MAMEPPRTSRSIFHPAFLDWLEREDDPPSRPEAEWSGDWKVFSMAPDRHLVLRGWEDPGEDAPTAIFCERSVALLCAAVLPLEARPTLFVLRRPEAAPGDYAILTRDSYGPEAESAAEPVGEVRSFSDAQLFALHLAAGLTRSPYALALVLEAAGPAAIRLAGEILHRRLGVRE